MVKARIPGSSQELYTVSVESVPQYTNSGRHGCCKGGRVGKDLLCGVLIALAVICAAVAIFLIVYYVVYGTAADRNAATLAGVDDNNATLDSSPLTRSREEESRINSLNENNWDDKDHLSLKSTPLPDVGIHDPEIHVESVAVVPPYRTGGQPPPIVAPPTATSTSEVPLPESTSSTTTTTTAATPEPSTASSTTTTTTEDDSSPLVEEKSEDIAKKSETTLFVPDDDVVIESPSSSSVSAELQTSPATQPEAPVVPSSSTEAQVENKSDDVVLASSEIPVAPALETSGFVPVKQQDSVEEEPEKQTEAAPEIAVNENKETPAVDTAPWKPIAAAAHPAGQLEARFIQDDTAADVQSIGKEENKSSTQALPASSTQSSNAAVVEVSSQPVPAADEEESTEFALMQDVGNMALLLPEDRIRTSSPPTQLLESNSTSARPEVPDFLPVSTPAGTSPGECIRRQLPFCRGVLPYSETVLPNWVGDSTEAERNLSVPYFEIIAESECHPRVQQYACAVLEPPCRANGISLPPCRQFCRAIAEDCKSYVLSALTLSIVLDCDRFPQSSDPNVCLNLASTTPEGECLPGEYRCNADNTCIPERWLCDGRQDCSEGDDEQACSQCTDTEFKCESEDRCVPQRWRCDGSRDCADGSDERDCPTSQDCGDGQFRCEDGLSCIPLRRVCDGSNHCRDNSDESNCTAVACQNGDFKCHDTGVCIPRQWVCDANWDCKDGSDEFECVNDDIDLIGDEEDFIGSSEQLNESNNTASVTSFNPEKCPLGQLLCISDMTCIRFDQLCDGTRDCSDGADETDCSSN